MVDTKTGENKVSYGLKNLHWHKVTDTGQGLTWGPGTKWTGASSIELDPSGDMAKVYADDLIYYSAPNNQGYTGKLDVYKVPADFEEYALGMTTDSNGLQTENVDSKAQPVALSFEFDGDVKNTRHFIYNLTFSRPKISSSTNTEKVDPKAQELDFTAIPDPYTGKVKTKSTSSTSDDVYTKWFDNAAGNVSNPATPTTPGK